jgi:hypothetical protein
VSDLFDIKALAGRWGVTEREAIETIRTRGVPYIVVGKLTDMRVNWRKARFSREAILEWEAGQAVVHPSAKRPERAKVATTRRPAAIPNLIGYRES